MSDYAYTRELVSGKYNIHFKGEDSKLHTEIETALPGKSVSKVKSQGTEVTVTLTPTLTAPEETTLDTVVQDHKDNASTNIKDATAYPYNDMNILVKDTTNSTSYIISGSFIFRGTDILGIPTHIKAILDSASGGDIKIYDVTNAQTICEKIGASSASPATFDLGVLSNLPIQEAIFEIQIRKVASTINIHALHVHF